MAADLFSDDEEAENYSKVLNGIHLNGSQLVSTKGFTSANSNNVLRPFQHGDGNNQEQPKDDLLARIIENQNKPLLDVFIIPFDSTISGSGEFDFPSAEMESKAAGMDIDLSQHKNVELSPSRDQEIVVLTPKTIRSRTARRERLLSTIKRGFGLEVNVPTPCCQLLPDLEYKPRSARKRRSSTCSLDKEEAGTDKYTPRRSTRKLKKIWDDEDDMTLGDIQDQVRLEIALKSSEKEHLDSSSPNVVPPTVSRRSRSVKKKSSDTPRKRDTVKSRRRSSRKSSDPQTPDLTKGDEAGSSRRSTLRSAGVVELFQDEKKALGSVSAQTPDLKKCDKAGSSRRSTLRSAGVVKLFQDEKKALGSVSAPSRKRKLVTTDDAISGKSGGLSTNENMRSSKRKRARL